MSNRPEPETTHDPGNCCYRHPDRESYILCQRCGRTICPACQTQAAVGFHCPECVRDGRASAPRTTPRVVSAVRRTASGGGPIVTYSLIAVCAVVYLLQVVSGGFVDSLLAYAPILTASQPWRMITSLFVHGSLLHVGFNMLSLFIFGRILEASLGRLRFLALYLLSGFGGSLAVLLLNPGGVVIGASGAIFGLLGAFFVLQRQLGGNTAQLLVFVGLNLLIGFIVPGIAWQAHVGGLITGGAVALVYTKTRAVRARNKQLLLLGGILAVLVAMTIIGFSTIFTR